MRQDQEDRGGGDEVRRSPVGSGVLGVPGPSCKVLLRTALRAPRRCDVLPPNVK